MFLALKEMRKEKGRFALVISIVFLISYLVYFLLGLANGLARDNTTAVLKWNGRQIVLQDGSNKNIQYSMLNRKNIEEKLKNENYSLINLSRSSGYINGKKDSQNTVSLTLIGTLKDSKISPIIMKGKDITKDDEAVASISLEKEKGLKLGDKVKISTSGKEFKIVGFTKEAKYNTSPVIYTDLQSASLYNNENKEQETVSGVIIHDNNKIDLDDKYEVISIRQFINSIPGYNAQILTFSLMIIFLVIISSIVLGVFLFIITIQKKQTFGIMKVQGISNRYIATSVLIQTIIVSASGLFLGFMLTIITDIFLPSKVPFRLNYLYLIVITALMIITSIFGTYFSVKSVAKVDPLEVLE